MTAKEVIDQYNFSKERIKTLESKKARITSEGVVKVTDYSKFGHGTGGGVEDKYCNRVEELQDIENEISWLKNDVAETERVFNWMRKTNEIELDIMLYKYTYKKNNKVVAMTFNYSERTIERKLKRACDMLMSVMG